MSSMLALSLIADCALRVGDPGYKTISIPQWTAILNEIAREMCARLEMKKRRTIFSLEVENAIYTYPDNMIQMVSLEYNPTPADAKTWRKLGEKFRDEFESITTQSYPSCEPTDYFADTNWLYTLGMPTAALADCMRLTYWGTPDTVTDPALHYIPVPDSAASILQAGMLSQGFTMLEKYDRADRQEQKYEKLVAQSELRITDRSDDRRQGIRPRSLVRGYGGQV